MLVNLPGADIRTYIDSLRPQMRGSVLKTICDGEAFINAFDSDKVKIILDIISAQIMREIESVMLLIKRGKFNKDEELRKIQVHCVGISKYVELVEDWENRLIKAGKHITKIKGG